MSMTALADHRAPDGRFAKGRSGNPAGRPKGARNHATILAETLEEAGPELVAAATSRALGGDNATLRALLHYLLPRPGDPTVELDLAPGAERDDEAVFDAALRAVADGAISPADGLRIGRLVALRAKLRLARTGKATPSPARGGGTGRGQHDATREATKRPLPYPPPHAGEGERAPVFSRAIPLPPVSGLYFRRDLRASTALAGGLARLRPSAGAAI